MVRSSGGDACAVGEGSDDDDDDDSDEDGFLEGLFNPEEDEGEAAEGKVGQQSVFPEVPGQPSLNKEKQPEDGEEPEDEDTEVVKAKHAKVPRTPTKEERI